MVKYTTFYEAYQFLDRHPAFAGRFQYGCLETIVVQVNPETEEIDEDPTKNTATRIWLECGNYDEDHSVHDINLDCGAPTYEEAIIELAALVLEHYGDYTEDDEITTFWDFVLTPSAKTYLDDTISILADYDGQNTVEGLKALLDETKTRLIKVARGDVSKEDVGSAE